VTVLGDTIHEKSNRRKIANKETIAIRPFLDVKTYRSSIFQALKEMEQRSKIEKKLP